MRKHLILACLAAGLGSGIAHAAETATYTYDARGRLIQVSRAGTINNGAVTTYSFDRAHNRTNKTTTGAP